jgi:hypothetical protein
MVVPAQDEVEAFAVTVGLGDSEAEAGGLAHEGQFGQFSLAFAGGAAGIAARSEADPGASLFFHGLIKKGVSGQAAPVFLSF